MGIFTYEVMKEFVVTFAFEALIILMAVGIISSIVDTVKRIVRMVRRHREKKNQAQDGATEQA